MTILKLLYFLLTFKSLLVHDLFASFSQFVPGHHSFIIFFYYLTFLLLQLIKLTWITSLTLLDLLPLDYFPWTTLLKISHLNYFTLTISLEMLYLNFLTHATSLKLLYSIFTSLEKLHISHLPSSMFSKSNKLNRLTGLSLAQLSPSLFFYFFHPF